MKVTPFYRDNHYVPQSYLKQWASAVGQVWTYRILVPHTNVPTWKAFSTKGIAYHAHLYTRIIGERETDEIEKWFGQEYETPTEPIINKVISGNRLTPDDWAQLIRFLAAQDVRTPARLLEFLVKWNETGSELMQDTLEKSVRKLETASKEKQENKKITPFPHSELLPLKISIDRESHATTLKAQSVIGRGLWLFNVKRALTNTVNVLLKHKWTILKSPNGINWCTSDDPVIKLNYYRKGHYDFKGGWGSTGTEIMLPISPCHLMYTKIGEKPPRRGTVVSEDHAKMIQQFIAEHAHRLIFAKEQERSIERLRPRVENKTLYEEEVQQWNRWHEENVRAERELGS